MPKQIITKEEVIERLVTTFREYGYEGTSLARLSEVTGLSKASLYHYFKDGKDQMVTTAFDRLSFLLEEKLMGLACSKQEPVKKFEQFIKTVVQFYDEGSKNCVVGVFNSGEASKTFKKQIVKTADLMQDAIARILEDLNYSKKEAKKEAEFIMIQIQGALVLARAKDDNKIFTDAMKRVKKTVLA